MPTIPNVSRHILPITMVTPLAGGLCSYTAYPYLSHQSIVVIETFILVRGPGKPHYVTRGRVKHEENGDQAGRKFGYWSHVTGDPPIRDQCFQIQLEYVPGVSIEV